MLARTATCINDPPHQGHRCPRWRSGLFGSSSKAFHVRMAEPCRSSATGAERTRTHCGARSCFRRAATPTSPRRCSPSRYRRRRTPASLLMDAAGYPSMSGHGGHRRDDHRDRAGVDLFARRSTRVRRLDRLDTPAGLVRARARLIAHGDARRVDVVAMTNVPAFVHAASEAVKIGTRQLRVDVAFGGAFLRDRRYGSDRHSAHCRAAARSAATGRRDLFVARCVGRARASGRSEARWHRRRHLHRSCRRIPKRTSATSRSVRRALSICPRAATGTSAVMAVLDAMGSAAGR